MKVLITGGTGFIGLNLQERLTNDYDIISPSRQELDLVSEHSVSAFFKEHHFDAVIHCATWDAKWNSTKDPSMILDYNVRMFFNLVRERDKFGKLISLGSGAEFSKPHWIPFVTEAHFDDHVPADPYGFSKYVINKYIEHMHDTVNLRLFGVFGKYEDWQTRFISNAICRAIHDLPIVIHQDVSFDYLYIDDLLNIIEWFLSNTPKEKTYNVCTNKTNRLTALARIILDILGKRLPIEVKQIGYGLEYSGNNARLLSEIKDLQFTPIDQSIKFLCSWYDANINRISRMALTQDTRFG